jgi:paraquat-inducible protein B
MSQPPSYHPDAPTPNGAPQGPHGADLARVERQRFSPIWLIPIIAAGLGLYLGWHTWNARGPMLTIAFSTGDGLTAGQTPVKYKAVQLGTVESVRLTKDMTHVNVRVRMRAEAENLLTDHARFWVVRPRISSGDISGLETLVSGAYIAVDPGDPGGEPKLKYIGLENPPGRRSDEPGTVYTLKADLISGLGQGSPIFYRDIKVGEVLGYDQPGLDGKITVHIFVRAPYDHYVRDDTRFWNASGVRVEAGAGGIQISLESLQAVLSGGVAFMTPPEARSEPPAKAEAEFPLFKDYNGAVAATSKDRILAVTYFESPISGLSEGSAVEINGMRVGSVVATKLEFDPDKADFRVAVHMALEPDSLAFGSSVTDPIRRDQMRAVLVAYLNRNPEAAMRTSSYLTGSMVMTLTLKDDPNATPPRMENGEIVLPSKTGGTDAIISSVTEIAAKLDKIPFDQIGSNLNHTLASVDRIVSNPEMRTLGPHVTKTLDSVRTLAHNADQGLQPVLKQANTTLDGYGKQSAFYANVGQLMDQANDTLRAVRALVSFLDRHPEALIQGRTGNEK